MGNLTLYILAVMVAAGAALIIYQIVWAALAVWMLEGREENEPEGGENAGYTSKKTD